MRLHLTIVTVPGLVRMRIAGTIVTVPLEYQNSMRLALALALELKTLGITHLAYADNLRKWGHEIETFVTGDSDILGNADKIQEQLEFQVEEPC